MKKLLLGISLMACSVLFCTNPASAQATGHTYQTAIGVKGLYGYRLGGAGALTVKHFVQPNAALEGLFNFGYYGMAVTGLYEFHGEISGAPGLSWYVGPGAHVGFFNRGYYWNSYGSDVYFGIDGVLGLEYKFNDIPLALSFDIQPSFNFPGAWFGGGGGFGIKFTL